MIEWIFKHLNWSVIILGILSSVCLFAYYYLRNHSKSVLSYVPNIWTSLGILGTFVSIVVSLKDLSFRSTELMDVAKLVHGIIPAFETSIIGILGAIVSSIAIKIVFAERDSEEEAIEERREKDLIRNIEKINTTLNGFAKKLAEGVLEEVNATLVSKLGELVSYHANSVNAILDTERKNLEKATETATKSFEEQTKSMKTAMTEMKDVCVKELSNLSATFRAGTAAVADDASSSIDSMRSQFITALSKGMDNQIKTILKEQDEQMASFIGKMDEKTSAVIKDIADMIQSEYDKLAELKALYDNISNGIAAVANGVQASVGSAVNESIAVLRDGFGGNIQAVKDIAEELKQISTRIGASSATYDNVFAKFGNLMDDLKKAEEGLNEILTRFIGTGAEVQEIYKNLEKVSEMNYALNFRLEQLRKGLRTKEGTSNSPIVCSHCHTEIENPMANFCPKCGNNLIEDTKANYSLNID